MVFFSRILLSKPKRNLRNYLRVGFRDSLRVFVAGGCGGHGYPKFGGIGGNGGDVKVVAKDNLTLNDVYKATKSKRYEAKSGRSSTHNFILGPPGEAVTFEVPVGVSVYTEMGKKLGELNEEGQELTVARGGRGGTPKNGFLGTKGEAYSIVLDLKLIADVGLVGFPNAGKSTLLKAISDAKPKIASYPFTTIRPNIGQVMYKDFRQISMADLPGLIEGAYANKGMGHKFLKHVERTKLLLFIVDINGFQLSPIKPFRSCLETILLLNRELELYNKDLLEKPAMLLINKMDTENAQNNFLEVRDALRNLEEVAMKFPEEMRPEYPIKFNEIMAISAKENKGDIEAVKVKLRRLLDVISELDDTENAELYGKIREDIRERGPRLV